MKNKLIAIKPSHINGTLENGDFLYCWHEQYTDIDEHMQIWMKTPNSWLRVKPSDGEEIDKEPDWSDHFRFYYYETNEEAE